MATQNECAMRIFMILLPQFLYTNGPTNCKNIKVLSFSLRKENFPLWIKIFKNILIPAKKGFITRDFFLDSENVNPKTKNIHFSKESPI